MLELIKNIPVNIWSVILGSVIAFGGVILSNFGQTKRLKVQLAHEKELKLIGRKAAMRREVYLSAAEGLVKASGYLGTFPQIDFANVNIGEKFQDFFATAAKLSLVAEDETANAVNSLVMAYSSLIFKLMSLVRPISDQKISINILNEHYDETQTEIKRILALMSHRNESGAMDQQGFDVLKSSFEFNQKKAKELSDERDEYWKIANDHTKEFIIQLLEELKVISSLQVPVMIGIRKELDIDTNFENYEKLTKDNSEVLKNQINEFLISLNRKA